MTNHANCGDCELGRDVAQTRTGERPNLRRAMKRAGKAQRRLNEAIFLASARGERDNTSSSSSESDGEGAAPRGRRSAGEGGRARFYPFHHGPWAGRHGMPGPHGPWGSMRGFPPGRHMMGFPGMRPHGVGPHPHHHHPGLGHDHHHGHGHHHHYRGAFGDSHPFGGHGGRCGRHGGMGRHGRGPWSGPFSRHFPHFGDVGHRSGRRERAQSVPRF